MPAAPAYFRSRKTAAGNDMEYVISHSFSQFQHENQLPQLEAKLMSLTAEASSITAAADEVAQEYNSLVKVSSLVNFFYPLMEACLRPCASLPNASPPVLRSWPGSAK